MTPKSPSIRSIKLIMQIGPAQTDMPPILLLSPRCGRGISTAHKYVILNIF
jgi:hypothetical protein